MPTTLLFVYGTLKRGGRANRLLAGARFVGPAVTEPRYRLVDLGSYPGLVDAADGVAVAGELYEVAVADLPPLDEFELAPDLYERRPVTLSGAAGPAEAYFYNKPVPPAARSGAAWPFPPAG